VTAQAETAEGGAERFSRPPHAPRRKVDWGGYPFLIPAFIFYIAFVLIPLGNTVWTSFFEWNGITEGTWVGLDNYKDALSDPQIRGALIHSFVFIIFYSFLPIVIGLGLAGLISRVKVRGLTVYRAVLFLPQILAMTVVAVAWRWVYAPDGPLNVVLDLVGLDSISRAWLGDFTWALPAIGLTGTWVMFGFAMVLFIAGVQKIPMELYEAARIDGAGAFREFFAVTLPQLRGELAVALVFTITLALRNFDLVWVSTGGGPGTSTAVPSVFIFKRAFQTGQVGSAAAVGVLLTILILGITAVVLYVVREKD
jgi:raffinose/stachyose/melibiose transport system permease protein